MQTPQSSTQYSAEFFSDLYKKSPQNSAATAGLKPLREVLGNNNSPFFQEMSNMYLEIKEFALSDLSEEEKEKEIKKLDEIFDYLLDINSATSYSMLISFLEDIYHKNIILSLGEQKMLDTISGSPIQNDAQKAQAKSVLESLGEGGRIATEEQRIILTKINCGIYNGTAIVRMIEKALGVLPKEIRKNQESKATQTACKVIDIISNPHTSDKKANAVVEGYFENN